MPPSPAQRQEEQQAGRRPTGNLDTSSQASSQHRGMHRDFPTAGNPLEDKNLGEEDSRQGGEGLRGTVEPEAGKEAAHAQASGPEGSFALLHLANMHVGDVAFAHVPGDVESRYADRKQNGKGGELIEFESGTGSCLNENHAEIGHAKKRAKQHREPEGKVIEQGLGPTVRSHWNRIIPKGACGGL